MIRKLMVRPFTMYLLRVTFVGGIGAVEIVYETSLQKTEPNIVRPRIPVSFGEQLDIHYFHVYSTPTMLGRKNGGEGCICMRRHCVRAHGGVVCMQSGYMWC